MKVFGKKISNETLWTLVFHIVLWSLWLGLPIMNAGDNERMRQFAFYLIPVTLTHIPFFLVNSEWLIPKIFRKRGIGAYLISLLTITAAFLFFRVWFKSVILPSDFQNHRHINWLFEVSPVLLVAAISTGYGFITYLLRQEQQQQQLEQERMRSELSFLRSQISPHFMFNVLNSIVYLIRSKSDMAEPVTLKLSELMRYMLYESEASRVPLAKEIEYLKNYVDLQKVRFEDDVDIRLQIEGEPQSFSVEPMLMIPFVENAFKHGVGWTNDPVIDIHIQIQNSRLIFSVKNKITADSPESKEFSSGIGLQNVRRRLQLMYPETHQLTIREMNGWFDVELMLKLDHRSTASNIEVAELDQVQ